jgi:hypothetical protein
MWQQSDGYTILEFVTQFVFRRPTSKAICPARKIRLYAVCQTHCNCISRSTTAVAKVWRRPCYFLWYSFSGRFFLSPLILYNIKFVQRGFVERAAVERRVKGLLYTAVFRTAVRTLISGSLTFFCVRRRVGWMVEIKRAGRKRESSLPWPCVYVELQW